MSQAALSGGYTAVACFPNTDPPIHSKSEVEYIRNRSRSLPIDIYPIGAVSQGCEGKELAELRDMYEAGAVGFSDGRKTLLHSGLMLRALQYCRGFGGLVINRPDDRSLSGEGQMHESETSVLMGLKGMPDLSEHVMIERDFRLLEYSASRLHCYGISSGETLNLIRQAKRSKLQLSASVPAINLLLEDINLGEFDADLKVIPPLRGGVDRRALIRGIKDGTIDCIVSNHEPVEEERKKMEFAYAGFGSTALETAFAMAHTACKGQVALETLISCLSNNPRTLLGLPIPLIREEQVANLTLFDPDVEWTVQPGHLRSKSMNAAALGRALTGCVVATIHKNAVHLAPEK
jgi:dihydroorotase